MLLLVPLLMLSGCGVDLMSWLPDFGTPPQPAQGAPSKPAKTLTRQDVVRQIQGLLAGLGYNPGELDGIEGPKTRAAISKFQAENGFLADGKVSRSLVNRLEVSLGDQTVRHKLEQAKTRQVSLARALPEYRTGSTYVYSDGRAETVVGVQGEKVHWRGQRRAAFTSYRNFALPWASWASDTGSGRRTLNVPPSALWPLKIGREISFSARTQVTPSSPVSKFLSVASQSRLASLTMWRVLPRLSVTSAITRRLFSSPYSCPLPFGHSTRGGGYPQPPQPLISP